MVQNTYHTRLTDANQMLTKGERSVDWLIS